MKHLLIAMFAMMTAAVWAIPAAEGRLDFYNNGDGATVKIADKGNASRCSAEKWMQRPNRGGALAIFKLQGKDWQTLSVTIQAVKDGKLEIKVMGPDVRKPDDFKTFLPANVDVAKVVANGKVLYDGEGKFLTVWHNAAKFYTLQVKDGEMVKVEVTARPSAE